MVVKKWIGSLFSIWWNKRDDPYRKFHLSLISTFEEKCDDRPKRSNWGKTYALILALLFCQQSFHNKSCDHRKFVLNNSSISVFFLHYLDLSRGFGSCSYLICISRNSPSLPFYLEQKSSFRLWIVSESELLVNVIFSLPFNDKRVWIILLIIHLKACE